MTESTGSWPGPYYARRRQFNKGFRRKKKNGCLISGGVKKNIKMHGWHTSAVKDFVKEHVVWWLAVFVFQSVFWRKIRQRKKNKKHPSLSTTIRNQIFLSSRTFRKLNFNGKSAKFRLLNLLPRSSWWLITSTVLYSFETTNSYIWARKSTKTPCPSIHLIPLCDCSYGSELHLSLLENQTFLPYVGPVMSAVLCNRIARTASSSLTYHMT